MSGGLERNSDPGAMNNDLQVDIMRVIWKRHPIREWDLIISHFRSIYDVYLLTVMCRFLLVFFSIDVILGEVGIRQRRKKLEGVTQGHVLSGAYTATLMRLKAQKGHKPALGLKVLPDVNQN